MDKTTAIKNAVIGNYWTTLWGILAGLAFYLNAQGVTFPTNKDELKSFGFSVLLAFIGMAAKDSNVGSLGIKK